MAYRLWRLFVALFIPWLDAYWCRRDYDALDERTTKIIANPKLLWLEYREGKLDAAIEGGMPAKILAAAFADQLRNCGAENYISLMIVDRDDDGYKGIGAMEVIIRKAPKGKSPAELVVELKAERVRLLGTIDTLEAEVRSLKERLDKWRGTPAS